MRGTTGRRGRAGEEAGGFGNGRGAVRAATLASAGLDLEEEKGGAGVFEYVALEAVHAETVD